MRDSQLASDVANRPIYKVSAKVYKYSTWTALGFDWEQEFDFEVAESDFAISGNSISIDGGGVFPIGNAISRSLRLSIKSSTEYAAADFAGAAMWVVIKMYKADGTSVTTNAGDWYFPREIKVEHGMISITASDFMSRTDILFAASRLEGRPLTLTLIYEEALLQSGFTPEYPSGLDILPTVHFYPTKERYTCRQIIAYVAMLQGKNAVIAAGTRSIKLVGLSAASPYNTLDTWLKFTDAAESVQVTGLRAIRRLDRKGNELETPVETFSSNFNNKYVLTIDNPFLQGGESAVLAALVPRIMPFALRRFSGTYISYPLAEYGDFCMITHMGGTLSSFITDVSWNINGATEIACNVDSASDNKATYGEYNTVTGNANPVGDVVIESNSDTLSSFTDSNGNTITAEVTRRWRKWSSGLLEQWVEREVSGETYTTALGALYRSAAIPMPPYAVEFADISNCVVGCNHDNAYIAWMIKYTQGSNTHPPDIAGVRHNNSGTLSGKLTVYAVGTWE